MKKLLLSLVAGLGGLFVVHAQISGLSYQSVVRTSAGIPIPLKQVGVRFSIHDSAASGPIIYQEVQLVRTNESGVINPIVGKGTASIGNFSLIGWNNGKNKYLQTEFDGCGCPPSSTYVDMGTTQLNSVAYASHSVTAGNGLSKGTTIGQMIFWNGSSWVQLNPGFSGSQLTICNGIPRWGDCPTVPVLITKPLSSILGSTFANTGGTISSDGGDPITAKGVCWSTSVNPTVALSTKTMNGVGTASYVSGITGLLPATTYHVRAYATNSVGTGYGADITFTTAIAYQPSVTIGTQVWSSKNLDVTTYRNGDPIPQIQDSVQWATATTGAWCWYNNDSVTYAATYGRIYNGYAVCDSRGLAPGGWHIPRETEWNKLVKYLDAAADTVCVACNQSLTAGGTLKATTGWNSPNGGATNSSGFAAMPGGSRNLYGNGNFNNQGSAADFWSAPETSGAGIGKRSLNSNMGNISRFFGINKAQGYSVRVVKD